jgi:hypothetical protein
LISLAAAYRYPVKSLGGEPLTSVELAPGRGIAGDRAYALVPAGADARAPGWRPKRRCVALVRNAPLARLAARVDPVSGALVIANGAGEVARGRPENGDERARIEAALNGALAAEVGAVNLAAAGPDAMLSDVDAPYVSLVNLASVEALGAAMGTKVDPLRFRANFYLRAPPAWCERGWIGRKVAFGGATLEIVDVIVRCAATEVNPATAERDLAILAGLAGFGHAEMGVYAKVLAGGRAERGAMLRFVE